MSFQKNGFAVRMFSKAMGFAAWLQALPNRATPPPFRLMQIESAFWQSRVLHVAARLDLATVIGDGRLTVDEIAARLSAHPDNLHRLMRMLAAMGIFAETAPRVFANNKLSAPLREDNPQSVRAMILMHNSPEMSRPWYEELEAGIRTGEVPFRRVHGQDLFDYMDSHPEFDTLFARAMDSVEALSGDSFATDFDWGRFDRLIDVGGSRGSKSIAILRRHPHLRALVVDRAQVIAGAAEAWSGRQSPQVLERLRFEPGDLFGALPAATGEREIYLLSAVMHGFDDEQVVTGLRNLRAACGATGARIVIMELVVPASGADLVSASFDMQMLMGTRGRERTLAEWTALAGRSGLALEEVVGLRSFACLLVLRAAAER
jgi:hypothetical protein